MRAPIVIRASLLEADLVVLYCSNCRQDPVDARNKEKGRRGCMAAP
jgi:hypothetical protein